MIQIGLPELLLLAIIAITASNPKSLISTLRGFIKNFTNKKRYKHCERKA